MKPYEKEKLDQNCLTVGSIHCYMNLSCRAVTNSKILDFNIFKAKLPGLCKYYRQKMWSLKILDEESIFEQNC